MIYRSMWLCELDFHSENVSREVIGEREECKLHEISWTRSVTKFLGKVSGIH